MTCNQLGGACEMEFTAATFDEIAELSKKHGMAMFMKRDPAHLEAMERMKPLMGDRRAMKEWFEEKRRAFEALPEDG